MAVSNKSDREAMLRDLFVALAPKWDIHDREGAKTLTRHCLDMMEGFYDVANSVADETKPSAKTVEPNV